MGRGSTEDSTTRLNSELSKKKFFVAAEDENPRTTQQCSKVNFNLLNKPDSRYAFRSRSLTVPLIRT
jgi:hypothetical protein